MKIAIADNCGLKFSRDIYEHLYQKGHEVKFERGASEHLAQWADLYYVDFWDNNIHYLYKLYNGDVDKNRTPDWDNNKKPRVVVRAIDWEVWVGLARDQAIIDWVDDVICIAPHIERELRKHGDFGRKLSVIKPGVNLEKFTLKTKKTDGYQLGMALGDMWWPKNHMGGLDIFTILSRKDPRWHLHIRGQHEGGNDFWKQMYEYYLDSRNIRDRVTLYPQVDSMNDWYENIDILLHPGMKEAFCYSMAEAMAKGIAVVGNDFYGSKDIWDVGMIYDNHFEAVSMLERLATKIEPNPEFYRGYIEKNYPLKTMLDQFDKLLGT